MSKISKVLAEHNYPVLNPGYPSREYSIEVLSELVISQSLEYCRARGAERIHFVTHSLGGILVRQYLELARISEFGRFVMLGPPNQGSELVGVYRNLPGFKHVVGPVGGQLVTNLGSVPGKLGSLTVDAGIISGTSTANPWTSLFLPNPNDGKVSVSSTNANGMCAHVQLPVSHRFMSRDNRVINNVLAYLASGCFSSPESKYYLCAAQGWDNPNECMR